MARWGMSNSDQTSKASRSKPSSVAPHRATFRLGLRVLDSADCRHERCCRDLGDGCWGILEGHPVEGASINEHAT
jgi:hypothetical protein